MKSQVSRTSRGNGHYANDVSLYALEDERLNALASAIFVYAITRPKNWTFNLYDVGKRFRAGRDALYKAMHDLELCGYLVRRQERNGQRQGEMVLIWKEHPELPDFPEPEPELPAFQHPENQHPEFQLPEPQHPENPEALIVYQEKKEPSNKNTEEKKEPRKEPLPDPAFDEFWRAYPNHLDRAKCRHCWNARKTEKYEPDDMIRAAQNYAEQMRLDETPERFIKRGSTFLGPDKPFLDWIDRKAAKHGRIGNNSRSNEGKGRREGPDSRVDLSQYEDFLH